MHHFILIASDSESLSGSILPAMEIAQRRLKAGTWPLYKGTPHKRDVREGDMLIVYLAGSRAMQFFAIAEAGGVNFDAADSRADEDTLNSAPHAVLTVTQAQIFQYPLPLARIKNQLEFIPKNTPKWGCVLQRGVKRISSADAKLITDKMKSNSG